MPKTSIVASFPPGFFLENITADHDNGLLVTCANRHELYYISLSEHGTGTPFLIHTFDPDQWACGVIAAPSRPGLFYIVTTDFTGQHSKASYLHVLNLTDISQGCKPYPILKFPPEATALNGFCALSDTVLLVADSFGSRIWRLDLDAGNSPPKTAQAQTWLSDPTMAGALALPDFQPGVNGLKYSSVTGYVYFTSTQQRLFCQVQVDPTSLEAVGDVEVVATGMQGDDLVVDDVSASGPVAYVTTHRDNTILRIPVGEKGDGQAAADVRVVARGNEDCEELLGPTAGAWATGRVGKTAFFTTDGGLKNLPKDGRPRRPRVLRIDF